MFGVPTLPHNVPHNQFIPIIKLAKVNFNLEFMIFQIKSQTFEFITISEILGNM